MICCEKLCFAYPQSAQSEDRGKGFYFDLQLAEQRIHALMGPSGVGKSTLLFLLSGFLQPESGDIRFGNRSVVGVSPADFPVSLLFQQNNLFAHLSVMQNIALGVCASLRPKPAIRAKIEQNLLRLGLQGVSDKFPSQLSGGQNQRVALCRTLLRAAPLDTERTTKAKATSKVIGRRPYILLDEPFVGLDRESEGRVQEMLREAVAEQGCTVLFSSHNQESVAACADSLFHIEYEKNGLRIIRPHLGVEPS